MEIEDPVDFIRAADPAIPRGAFDASVGVAPQMLAEAHGVVHGEARPKAGIVQLLDGLGDLARVEEPVANQAALGGGKDGARKEKERSQE